MITREDVHAAIEIAKELVFALASAAVVVGTICDRLDPDKLEKEGSKQFAQFVRWGRRAGVAATAYIGIQAAGAAAKKLGGDTSGGSA